MTGFEKLADMADQTKKDKDSLTFSKDGKRVKFLYGTDGVKIVSNSTDPRLDEFYPIDWADPSEYMVFSCSIFPRVLQFWDGILRAD